MNRCKTPTNLLLFLSALRRRRSPACSPSRPSAQEEVPRPQTQNESLLGGRTFPIGALRGKFMVVDANDVRARRQRRRGWRAGARIRNQQNLLQMTGALVGQLYLVNYTRDAAGLLREVWILTPEEASASP
jgi:hypothetical protein